MLAVSPYILSVLSEKLNCDHLDGNYIVVWLRVFFQVVVMKALNVDMSSAMPKS
ncbi:hypothetical protein PsAD37_04189 [Pseudovibrio sp. Ad37]|nr:hypothetical protein PsAD37_04189 [Pseudovibrio sp. Ad37]KZL17885.1 hypothetical protein PsWM33_05138 [Pseudovibrio sp. WM33]